MSSIILIACIFPVAIWAITPLDCSAKAREFTEFHHGLLSGVCAGGCLSQSVPVKGSQVYTDDSSICKAAIHAGVINDNGGTVQIRRLPGRKSYSSTVHNGITSSRASDWIHSKSFEFISTTCMRPLGLRSNVIPDRNFRSSGILRSWLGDWHAYHARLDKGSFVNAWRPAVDNTEQWWQIDMGDIYDVKGIVSQGSSRHKQEQYITSFKIQHRITSEWPWLYVLNEKGTQKLFKGNTDNDGRVTNHFVPNFVARYIRLIPVTWKNHISLRAEILVCPLQP